MTVAKIQQGLKETNHNILKKVWYYPSNPRTPDINIKHKLFYNTIRKFLKNDPVAGAKLRLIQAIKSDLS